VALQTFAGYRRPDGSVGVRNHVLVLGINGLIARASQRIAAAVSEVICVTTGNGRGQIEPDLGIHLDQLIGLGCNPNIAAVLVVGADEDTTMQVVRRIRQSGKPVESISLAELHEDTLALCDVGVRRLAHLIRRASRFRREAVPLSELVVGVECGHSDASSGIAANRVVGAAVDALIDRGATVIGGETVEWLGAEHLLARRAADAMTGTAIIEAVERRERMVSESGQSLTGNNPGEENIRGGLSTIEEKSLGAVSKIGTRPIRGLLALTERPGAHGLYLMDGPCFSPESMTGFAAVGVQLMLFTTGAGNSFASAIAPTVKISARAETLARLPEQIDFDASSVFLGREDAATVAARLLIAIHEIAEGTLSWGEVLREGLEVPTRVRGSL
jgi:altronate dehydratase large subunit